MTQRDLIERDFIGMTEHAFRVRYAGRNRIRCGMLLIRESDSKILMVKEKPRGEFAGGIYGPPKGQLEKTDKSLLLAARRELYEETGITIKNVSGTSSAIFIYHPYHREVLILFPMIVNESLIEQGQTKCDEIDSCGWYSVSEIQNLPKAACTARLLKILAFLREKNE